MNPLSLLMDSGVWGLIICVVGLLNLLIILVQIPLIRRVNLLPLAWAGVIAVVFCGMLGTVAGLMMGFDAMASASPDTKQMLMAAAASIAMSATALGLMIATVEVILVGMVSCFMGNLRHRESSGA